MCVPRPLRHTLRCSPLWLALLDRLFRQDLRLLARSLKLLQFVQPSNLAWFAQCSLLSLQRQNVALRIKHALPFAQRLRRFANFRRDLLLR